MQNTCPVIPFVVNLDEYINKAAGAQTEPALARELWINNETYFLQPAGHFSYSVDTDGMHKMFAAKDVREHDNPTTPGTKPKLIPIDAHTITNLLHKSKPGTTASVSQGSCSTSTELHRPTAQLEREGNGRECAPEENDEIQMKEDGERGLNRRWH